MTNPGNERTALIEAEGIGPLASKSGADAGGSAVRPETEVREVRFNRVDVNFFRIFEVPLLAGRGFEPADVGATPGLGNEDRPKARRWWSTFRWPNRFSAATPSAGAFVMWTEREPAAQSAESGRWYEIVGIVSDFPTGASQGMRDTKLKVYHAAAAGQLQPAAIAMRMRGGAPTAFTQRLREIAAAVDPDLQLRDIRGLDEALRSEQWISRLQAGVFVAVTLSVLMLSSAGIYALMSFTVSQRRKEIGIRMALGADWKRIVASIFSRALLTAWRWSGARPGLGSRDRYRIGGRSSCGATRRSCCLSSRWSPWRSASWRRSGPPAAAYGSSRLRP